MKDEELRERLKDIHDRLERMEQREDFEIGITNLSLPLLILIILISC
jgi:hypothetical protein